MAWHHSLIPQVPRGTELDSWWTGGCFVIWHIAMWIHIAVPTAVEWVAVQEALTHCGEDGSIPDFFEGLLS